MIKLVERHPKWGYRLIHGLLVEEGWPVDDIHGIQGVGPVLDLRVGRAVHDHWTT